MRKIFLILTFAILLGLSVKPVFAQKEAGQSAALTALSGELSPIQVNEHELHKKTLQAVLARYNSPMIDEVDTYLDVCEKYELNCYLVPSISGVESGFGNQILRGTFNPFGWGGGTLYFASWKEAITTVAKALRERYVAHGAVDLDAVGHIYAESPTWSVKVRHFQAEFEREEEKQKELYFSVRPVEL